MVINNVIICGLGALGLTYADKLNDKCCLKILANEERIEKYLKTPPIFNDKQLLLNYITPKENFSADLVIISTKSSGLESAIEYLKNFVSKNTIIISLINGISSEEKIKKAYPDSKVLNTFFIGHSAMSIKTSSTKKYIQDGVGKIVMESNLTLENFFKNTKIDYEISENIIYSQWVKLGVNIILNQLSALYKTKVGETRKLKEYPKLSQELLKEIKEIALALNIENLENFEKDVMESIKLIADDGKTSMYQDVILKKKTEVDIFSGEIIALGEKYGIKTPHNKEIYNKIKLLERDFL